MENEKHRMVRNTDGKDGKEQLGAPIVSRRALIGGAAALGFLTLVPRAPGTNLVPFPNAFGPETAYADDWTGAFTFTVVGSDEVAFQILDVSDESQSANGDKPIKGKPVKDATVTLTKRPSNPNAKQEDMPSVTGITKSDGTVILSIRDLAFDTAPKDGVFQCNCSISITSEKARIKMRDFSAGLLTLEGATGVVVGTHRSDSKDVYFERCTFDDWDVHYSKLTFLRSEGNDADHTILTRIKGVTENVKVTLTIINAKTGDTNVNCGEVTAKYNAGKGYAVASWTQKFLYTKTAYCITSDEAILRFTFTVGGKKYTNDIEIFVEDTPIDGAAASGDIVPFNTDAESIFSFEASGDWPCFNGLSFSLFNPAFPLQIAQSIYAITIGIGTDISMLDDDGKPSATAWKKDHKDNVIQRYQDKLNEINTKMEQKEDRTRWANITPAADDCETLKQKHEFARESEFLGNYSINLIGRVIFYIGYAGFKGSGKDYKKTFEGGATVELGFSASGTFTCEFFAGPVPMFWSATLGLTAIFSLTEKVSTALAKTTRELDCSKLTYKLNGGFSFYMKISLNVSIGVGYDKLFSLAFSTTFSFPFLFTWADVPDASKADPHIVIGVTILFELVFQCCLFRMSGQIYNYDMSHWFDNWPSDGTAALTGEDAWEGIEPRFKLTHPDGTFRHTVAYSNDGQLLRGSDDPFADMIPVTDALMFGARDADAKRVSVEADEVDEAAKAARFAAVEGEEGVFRNAYGTSVYKDKMPKPVVKKDGSVGTELVDCKGVNTFYFGDTVASQEGSGTIEAQASAKDPAIFPHLIEVAYADEGAGANAEPGASGSLGAAALTVGTDDLFEGDPMLGFALGAGEEYDYTPVEGKTTGAYCGPDGIKGIANSDGVVPTVDAVIFKDVQSDSRQRVVSIGGVPYLFRVATVSYPDTTDGTSCRSRVVASAFDLNSCTWGAPKVVEYNTGNKDLPRVDMYDYDFDIVVRSGSGTWTQGAEACLVVVGGLRPNGDSTTVYDAFANPTVAIVLLDADLRVVQRSVQGVADIADDGKSHMLCSPCVVDGFGPDGASGVLAYSFLHRSASSKTGMTRAGASVTFNVGYCYARDGYLCLPQMLKKGPALNAGTFGIGCVAGAAVSDKYDALLTVLATRTDGYDVCSAVVPPKGSFKDLAMRHCIASGEGLPEVQPWHRHGTFLYVKQRGATPKGSTADYHLYEGTFDPLSTGQAGFSAKQVDAHGFKGGTFCVSPAGEFVFYYESFRDKPGADPEADMVSSNVSGSGDDTVYRIVASRLMNGKFSEDFPFCDLSHPVDRFEILDFGDAASAFVATHITDADRGLANMNYISVPNTIAAEIEAFAPTGIYAYAGHPCEFQLDVRNHGNLIIGGFDVSMLDPARGNQVVSSVHIGALEPKSMMVNATHLGWGNARSDSEEPEPVLTDEEQQGLFMPGRLISYKASFDIPSDWKGDKRVFLRITNAWSPGMQVEDTGAAALEAQAADVYDDATYGPVHRYFHAGVEGHVSMFEGEASTLLYDPHEKVEKVGDDPDNPVNPVNPPKPGGGTAPRTGDPLGIMGPLAAALGGLGALMAGYSARRVRNEREREEGEEV